MILEGSGVMNLNPSNNLLHQPPAWTDSYPTCNVSSGFFGGQWHEIHPQYWTKYQVWEWLQHLLDTNQLDASCIPFQEFDINGEHLCSMSLQEFTRAAGTAGQLLYSNLQHLKWNGNHLFLSLSVSLLPSFPPSLLPSLSLSLSLSPSFFLSFFLSTLLGASWEEQRLCSLQGSCLGTS
uniref:ETS homologous factor n=1 Tax=Sus scrofa TaxID=9823 RepID=A0A8D1FES1_PIG